MPRSRRRSRRSSAHRPGHGGADGTHRRGLCSGDEAVCEIRTGAGDAGLARRRRRSSVGRSSIESTAAPIESAPAAYQAMAYVPSWSRTRPAPVAATAAPIWCAANTQPKTTAPRSPKYCRHSATVGGTVATQSNP
jgi:hypothetical protein